MPILKALLLCLTWSSLARSDNAIRIHLYDYVGVSGATLAEAKEIASSALERAGVALIWADCPTPNCERPSSPEVLQIRIIDRAMRAKTSASKACLGYAVVWGEFSSIASVFYHQAVELEKERIAQRGQILGAVLAHEIGHLLLGKDSHARVGIMRDVWDSKDQQIIARGRMSFSRTEAKKLAANAEARQRASTGR